MTVKIPVTWIGKLVVPILLSALIWLASLAVFSVIYGLLIVGDRAFTNEEIMWVCIASLVMPVLFWTLVKLEHNKIIEFT
jgi:hypothetical protein